jgi:hypothetical protein
MDDFAVVIASGQPAAMFSSPSARKQAQDAPIIPCEVSIEVHARWLRKESFGQEISKRFLQMVVVDDSCLVEIDLCELK